MCVTKKFAKCSTESLTKSPLRTIQSMMYSKCSLKLVKLISYVKLGNKMKHSYKKNIFSRAPHNRDLGKALAEGMAAPFGKKNCSLCTCNFLTVESKRTVKQIVIHQFLFLQQWRWNASQTPQ